MKSSTDPEWWGTDDFCDICYEELTGGSHWHCGRCNSPELTGMFGHYVMGRFTCTASDGRVDP